MGGADEATATPRLNRLAIGSVVASAVTLFGIGSLVGIALGVVAWNQSKVRGEGGRGLALAGVALGAVTLLVSMIVVVKWIGAG
jgi:hypothetical protein